MSDLMEQERARLVAWLEKHCLPIGARIDREIAADALMADFITPRLAELAALRARDREDGARAGTQEHYVITLRYMLERAERMSLSCFRADLSNDAARYRKEADALAWALATLPLSPARTEVGDA